MLLNKFSQHISVSFLVCLLVLSACDGPECETRNSFLQQAPMNSTQYNLEIARMINTADSGTVRFFFEEYKRIEDKDFILVEVHTLTGCALGRFTIDNKKGLETLIAKAGKSYRGAEFTGFEFTINGDSEPMYLVCNGVAGIID
ncbi:MAG: hypothetical protein JXQ87_08385 [Bacteroidia bacterium]